MKIILVGTVKSTLVALETMIEKSIKPITVVTLPLSKAYRHSDFVDLRPLTLKYNIPIIEASNINNPETIEKIKSFEPDYMFVIGWSQILNKEVLAIPSKGSIGYHPAPLPKNRGRAVIPWAILQGEKETGSTLFWLDEGVDSGDILLQKIFPVDFNETATTLYEKHLKVLKELLLEALSLLINGKAPRIPQDHTKATYCAKRTPADGYINWDLPAKHIWTLIRAVTEPYPGAFTFYKGKKLIIWEADYIGDAPYCGIPGQIQAFEGTGALVKCGDGNHILLKVVQLEGEDKILPRNLFKLHEKLGIDFISLYQKLHREKDL
jgi:methionyl-tRNA formyltransferase